jgi:hypothetical protein
MGRVHTVQPTDLGLEQDSMTSIKNDSDTVHKNILLTLSVQSKEFATRRDSREVGQGVANEDHR